MSYRVSNRGHDFFVSGNRRNNTQNFTFDSLTITRCADISNRRLKYKISIRDVKVKKKGKIEKLDNTTDHRSFHEKSFKSLKIRCLALIKFLREII